MTLDEAKEEYGYDLDFKPKTPLSLLKKQSRLMFDYLNVLSERAIYEGINLD